jgi:predicted nucleic acid-binding protein
MRILIDTNRIIAALIKKGTSRSILLDENFKFVTPDYTITEIEKHKEELKKKTKLSDKEFKILLALIFEHIEIIPKSEYDDFMNSCKDLISDPDDVPHLAACIASKAYGIWAHDPIFKEQQKVKVLTNIDMLKISGKARNPV